MIEFKHLTDYTPLLKWLTPELISQTAVAMPDWFKPHHAYGVYYDGELIGWMEAFNIEGTTCEVGIALPGKNGVSQQVSTKFIDWLFSKGFTKLTCKVYINNVPGLKSAIAAGFSITQIKTNDRGLPYYEMERGA